MAYIGALALALWGLPAILIEAVLLRLILPGTRALRNSVVMNLITTAVGLGVGLIVPFPLYELAGKQTGIEGMLLYYGDEKVMLAYLINIALLLGLLGVVIEGAILQFWLEPRAPAKRVWAAALAANAASYAMGLCLPLLLLAG